MASPSQPAGSPTKKAGWAFAYRRLTRSNEGQEENSSNEVQVSVEIDPAAGQGCWIGSRLSGLRQQPRRGTATGYWDAELRFSPFVSELFPNGTAGASATAITGMKESFPRIPSLAPEDSPRN